MHFYVVNSLTLMMYSLCVCETKENSPSVLLPFLQQSQHSMDPENCCTCQQFRWALTKAQRPADSLSVSLTGWAHIVIVLGIPGQLMGLSSQCLSHSQPGWAGQTLFDPRLLRSFSQLSFSFCPAKKKFPCRVTFGLHQFPVCILSSSLTKPLRRSQQERLIKQNLVYIRFQFMCLT